MNDDQGMREEDAPVSAEMRAVRMAAYNIVAHIDEFGQFWDEDINAFDTATAQLSGITDETSSGLEPLTAEAVNHVLSLLEVYVPDEFSQEMAANVVSRALEAVKRFPAPPVKAGVGS